MIRSPLSLRRRRPKLVVLIERRLLHVVETTRIDTRGGGSSVSVAEFEIGVVD